jgi:hypothetical protein
MYPKKTMHFVPACYPIKNLKKKKKMLTYFDLSHRRRKKKKEKKKPPRNGVALWIS